MVKDIKDRVCRIRDSLGTGLVERDLAVRLALLAALSGEHLLLVGPPGTAKSLVARRLRHAFANESYFERLLTRFSVPEELFGPLSIKGLEEDRYERLTESYLPTASIAFLDEIFKANSAILNALLTLLNEREFDNGTRRDKTPLVAVVAASNELPEGEELDALFDRFLLRLHVGPVSRKAFRELLGLRGSDEPSVQERLRLTRDDLDEVQARAEDVEVTNDVLGLLRDLRGWCIAEEIPVSDRRWRKVVKLLQTSALTNGRDTVSIWDCWLLQHCLWSDAGDRERIYRWYASRVGAATDEPSSLIRYINSLEGGLKKDKEDKSQLRDGKGNLLYLGGDGKHTPLKVGQKYRGRMPLFKAPQDALRKEGYSLRRVVDRDVDRDNNGKGYSEKQLNEMHRSLNGSLQSFTNWSRKKAYLKNKNNWITTELDPAIGATRHKTAHVEKRLKDVHGARESVETHKTGIEKQIETFEHEIRNHLWVTQDFVKPASKGLSKRLAEAEELLDRLTKLKEGYESLPLEEEPPPLAETQPKRVQRKRINETRTQGRSPSE